MSVKMNAIGTGPRIIIDVNLDGSSTMKVRGNLNMAVVSLVLSNQLNALLPKMFQEMFKGLAGPNGQPVATSPPLLQGDSIEITEDEPPETGSVS